MTSGGDKHFCVKNVFRSLWFWSGVFLLAILVGGVLFLRHSVDNVMNPALDQLSAIPLAKRWSHPEMLKIRALGVKAVPPLRSVLREKNSSSTRFLLWVQSKWPAAGKSILKFPDMNKMSDRRWAACQALQSLGPAGRPAVPEILDMLREKDMRELNAATMALHAIGIDAEICDQLDELLEAGTPPQARFQIINALGRVKPASPRTVKNVIAALADSSPYVQASAIGTLGHLGVATPEILSALKQLQSTNKDPKVLISLSEALWLLEKDSKTTLDALFPILESELANYSPAAPGGIDSGQGIGGSEQLFLKAGSLFAKMKLQEPEKSRAFSLLKSCCDKSDRIFVRMCLLPDMMELGLQKEECVTICRKGLKRPEDYYRIQAARLMAEVGEKYSLEGIDLTALLQDPEVGVRVYAAKMHWLKNRQAAVVVPILIEALDRNKHQSYYYPEILRTAISTLGEMGAEAKEAKPVLEKIKQDPDPTVVKLATDALGQM